MDTQSSGDSGDIANIVIKRQKFHNRVTRSTTPTIINQYQYTFPGAEGINDSLWGDMWHVHEDTHPSMGIYEAWTMGYSGAGIHVNIVDDGIEADHPDLVGNLNVSGGYHLNDGSAFHGTLCAGLVSAVMNDLCIVGTAYNSTVSDVTVLGWPPVTDYGESLGLTHNLEHTDIYSNSWGPSDEGYFMEGPEELTKDAIEYGAQQGRNGLGAIYVWAAGNGGFADDDCNADGYINNIHTIAVTSIGPDRQAAWYSEKCSSLMVATYSGDSPDISNSSFPTIPTTAIGHLCSTTFQGTSASAPIAAGVIAMTLEANPLLTWRDIQHLLVRTSIREGLDVSDWTINGAVSHEVGFGLINAVELITSSMNWVTVPQQVKCEHEFVNVSASEGTDITYYMSEYISDGCNDTIRYIEHVEVTLSLDPTRRGRIEITLTSPSSTESTLLHRRQYDYGSRAIDFTFMTVLSWGESPNGSWLLEINSTSDKLSSSFSTTTTVETQKHTEEDDTKWIITGVVLGGSVAMAMSVGVIVYFFKVKPNANIIRVRPIENE
ncbi:Proprotein convertase subtilisin kexin type [Mactra antiquata]